MYNSIKMDNKILTTISGSLPKPNWLAEPEKLWSPWLLQGEELKKGKRDAIKIAVKKIINGETINNIQAIANPEALDFYKKLNLK